MLIINLKLAFRNLWRNKLYSIINIACLAIACAFGILVYWYVGHERSFDNFHHDGQNLFRVEHTDLFGTGKKDAGPTGISSWFVKDAEQMNMLSSPQVLAADLKNNFPEIEDAVRVKTMYEPIVRINGNSFKEDGDHIAFADAGYFKIFDLGLLQGNAATVLANGNSAVLSERLAKKYFGRNNPIGQTLQVSNSKQLLTVTGICADPPTNSSLRYDMLVSRQADADYEDAMKSGREMFTGLLFVRIKPNTDAAAFRQKLNAFAKSYYADLVKQMNKTNPGKPVNAMQIYLRPFADAHYNQSGDWPHYTDINNIYQLAGLALIIIVIACLNYTLLTLTNTISRSQDVGIRKTIGADRKQIIWLYYTETQLLAIISAIAGCLIAVVALPYFCSLTGSDMQLADLSVMNVAATTLILALVLGLLAGVYPALIMSGLRPLNIMRGLATYKLSPSLSKAMVIVQFSICVVLITSSMVINRQMKFISQKDLGFNKDLVVLVRNPYEWFDAKSGLKLRERLGNYVAGQPSLQAMTTTSFNFGGYNMNSHLINGQRVLTKTFNVDLNYFSFNKIGIIKGREFSAAIPTDTARSASEVGPKAPKSSAFEHHVVVNETLYNMLGKPVLGQNNRVLHANIIGVCKDYHTDNLTQKIGPAYHQIYLSYVGYYWIKIKAGQQLPQVLDHIQSFWKQETNNLPFSYTFLDEDVAQTYKAYTQWMRTINISCILAILIACMGLFGLSAITTLNRTKEIGIRKVLGASVLNLFVLVNRHTFYLVLVSFVIATPLAYYLANQWLSNFAYRITPNWGLFAGAGSIAIITAILAVSYHTVKVALTNPVKSLRSE